MSAPGTETLGLRERKRRATRYAIQHAVVSLSLEHGFDRVTIEDIGHRADISPRTFFNYFASKEAAAIGDAPGLPDDATLQIFVEGDDGLDVLEAVGHLFVQAADEASGDGELLRLRRDMLRGHPRLFAMRMATMKAFEEELAEVISRRLARQDPTLAADPATLADRARLVTLVAFAAMRHAWAGWADNNGRDSLPDGLSASFTALRTLIAPEPAK